MPLEEVSIREHARDDLAFQIAYRGDSVNVRAASARQCIAWMEEVERARRTALVALQKRRSSRA
jgi:actin cytoskeleton-regulatory complex protein PAN1